jgi:hypothetical protein
MKRKLIPGWILAVALATALPVGAQQTTPEKQEVRPTRERESKQKEPAEKEVVPLIVYIPPPRGTPRARVGAATRGVREDFPRLEVLAPDHVGLTLEAQPTLTWYISGLTDTRIDLALIDDESVKPLLEITLTHPVDPGVHALRLEDYGVSLESGTTYQWFVVLVPDSERRSNDIIAGGAIERVAPAEGLRRDLASAERSRIPGLLATHGIWYDAIASLSDLMESDPADPELRRARAELLEQIGLQDVAPAVGP